MLHFSRAHCLFFLMRDVCTFFFLYHNLYVPFPFSNVLINFNFLGFIVNLSQAEHGCESSDDAYSLKKIHQVVERNDLLGDDISDPIRCLLPDDEDALLSGVMDGFDIGEIPNCTDDLEEYDIFGNGGGLELESDFPRENLTMGASRITLSDTTGVAHCGLSSGGGAITGEHPLGEHPSRTLFVRNINSNVEDSELRTLFEVILITPNFKYYSVLLLFF